MSSMLSNRSLSVLAVLCLTTLAPDEATGAPLTSLTVKIHTADALWAGTNDSVSLHVKLGGELEERKWPLDDPNDGNDFERNDHNTITITTDLPSDSSSIRLISIHKSADGFSGGWKLGGVTLYINGDPSQIIYSNESINQWIEDGYLQWAPPIDPSSPGAYTPPAVPAPAPLPRCSVMVDEFYHPDADCDGLPDSVDSFFNPPDRDGDGLPDRTEDWDGDGVVGAGETDPGQADSDADGVPDGRLPDTDDDGLPDKYEEVIGTDPSNPDSDGDGWRDGPTNFRLELVLYRVHCENEQEDIGGDELFIVNDDVRAPFDLKELDGTFNLEGGREIFPMVVVARRTLAPGLPTDFSWRVGLGEDDWTDWSDDQWGVERIEFDGSDVVVVHHYRDDGWADTTDYTLEFWINKFPFSDPNPLDAEADAERDGLTEAQEYDLSAGYSRSTGVRTKLAGDFNGLADPNGRDLFVELDASSAKRVPQVFTKVDAVSHFYYHDIVMHLADVDSPLGGGQVLGNGDTDTVYFSATPGQPSVEGFYDDPTKFDPARKGIFHYAVAAGVVRSGEQTTFGQSSHPRKDDVGANVCYGRRADKLLVRSRFWSVSDWSVSDSLSDFDSIILIHELGHNLGLCHRPGDMNDGFDVAKGPSVVSPECFKFRNADGDNIPESGEYVDANGNGAPDSGEWCGCTHYWVESDSDTAMGGGFHRSTGGAVAGAVAGAAAGAAIGAAIGSIAGPPGTIVGGILGGLLGGVGGAALGSVVPGGIDAIDREVQYEDAEWRVVDLTSVHP